MRRRLTCIYSPFRLSISSVYTVFCFFLNGKYYCIKCICCRLLINKIFNLDLVSIFGRWRWGGPPPGSDRRQEKRKKMWGEGTELFCQCISTVRWVVPAPGDTPQSHVRTIKKAPATDAALSGDIAGQYAGPGRWPLSFAGRLLSLLDVRGKLKRGNLPEEALMRFY